MPNRFRHLAWGAASVTMLAAATPLLAQPANDTCLDAAPLSVNSPVNGTTVDALLDLPVSCQSDSADVWYSFTPPASGPYLFSASGDSNADLTLAVLSGCDFPIAEFGCAVGAPEAGPSLQVLLYEGSPVVVRVGSTLGQAFTVTAGPLPPPPNDDCSGAIDLPIGQYVNSDNLSATTTLEFPDSSLCGSVAPGIAGGADVFFSFTPPSDGFYDFSTCGCPFDSVISVHAGCPATAENAIACNDNAPIGFCQDSFDTYSSYLGGVALTGGVTYYVRVASVLPYNPDTGELGEPGRGLFSILANFGFEHAPPPNDACETAAALNADSTTTGTTVNATGDGPGPCGGDDVWDVWYSFTSQAADRRVFRFTIQPGAFNSQATMTVYHQCGGTPLLCGAFNPFSNPDMTVWVALDPGESIKLRVAGVGATQGDFTLETATGGPGAENVSCAAAAPLDAGQTVVVDTAGADYAEPSACGFADTSPLWYSFTPGVAGYYRIATDFPYDPESSDRTTLSVYSACGEPALVCTGQGDGSSTNPSAGALAVHADAGETLYFRVSYEAPRRGQFDLGVEGPLAPPPPVPNDTCGTATTIGTMPYHAQEDITLATPDQDVCAFEGQPAVPTPGGVWFTFTADVDRVFRGRVTNLNTGEPGRATVFTGDCGSLVQVSCPHGGPADPTVHLSAGVTYHILASLAPVDGNVGAIPYGTTLDFDFVALPIPVNDHCNTAARITSSDSTFDVNTLAADADTPGASCFGFDGTLANGVWYTFTTGTAGTLTVHGEGSNPEEGLYSPGGVLYTGPCGALTEIACDSPLDGFFITRHFDFTADLDAGQTYHLAVGSFSADLGGGETAVHFQYTGELSCRADFNADGSVNSQDFFDFITAFFAADPRADFNADGSVNSQDFFDFLPVFFGGCG